MNIRRSITNLVYSLIILCGCCSGLLTSSAFAQTNPPPWVSLFNGTDLKGWSIKGGNGKAWVQDGEIVCHQTTSTLEHTFVCTDVKFGDFILEADCKIDGDFNSGILFRAIDMPDVKLPKTRLNGYQVKIDPTPRKWTGGVFEDYGGPSWQSYYNLADDARAREAFKIGEWNKFRVEAIGKSIKVWVNGVPTANLTHDKYSNGYIALKIHALGNKPEPEKVLGHFNNIRIITENSAAYAQPMSLPATTALETAAPKRQTEVSIRGEDFYINGQPTYKGRVWNAHRIEGLLLNSRMVQGIFDDLNPETTNRWAYPDTRKWDRTATPANSSPRCRCGARMACSRSRSIFKAVRPTVTRANSRGVILLSRPMAHCAPNTSPDSHVSLTARMNSAWS
jgi:hypothetical protein